MWTRAPLVVVAVVVSVRVGPCCQWNGIGHGLCFIGSLIVFLDGRGLSSQSKEFGAGNSERHEKG